MHSTPHAQRGFTLIEVLVSILIFLFGVMGLIALQSRVTQLSNDAEDRNRAALLANEGVQIAWASGTSGALNPAAYAAWQAAVATPQNNTGAGVSSGLLGLPNGQGTIVLNPGAATPNTWTVTITWQEPSSNVTHSYSTSTTPN